MEKFKVLRVSENAHWEAKEYSPQLRVSLSDFTEKAIFYLANEINENGVDFTLKKLESLGV